MFLDLAHLAVVPEFNFTRTKGHYVTCGKDSASGTNLKSCLLYCQIVGGRLSSSVDSKSCTPTTVAPDSKTVEGYNEKQIYIRVCAKTVDRVGNKSAAVCKTVYWSGL